MKKFLLPVTLAFLIACGFYLSLRGKNGHVAVPQQDVVLDNDIEDANKQEELAKRENEEFLKTVDPRLGYVPSDRIIAGEERARQIMQDLRTNRPDAISSLTWAERGPNNVGGRTRAFVFDQSDATGNTALAGGVGGGLWRTTNFKTGSPVTWTKIASISQNLAITCIAQDPQTPGTFYAGTGEGYNNIDAIRGSGLYKSIDRGLTWALLPSTTTGGTNVNDFSFVQDIIVYNNASHDVYAACRSAIFCNAGGLMRSSNGGNTWTRVIGTYPGGTCTSATDFKIFDIEVSASGDLWVSSVTEATGIGKIWKSPAGALVGNTLTWVDKTPTGTWQRIDLACSKTNNNRIYALMQGTTNAVGSIKRTDDGAAAPASSWTDVTNTTLWCDQGTSSSTDFSRNQAWYDLIIQVNPTNDANVLAGGVDVMSTTTSGASWSQLTQWASGCAALPNVHADIHNIVYLPGSSTEFVITCDGGVYYTGDGGTTFVNKNTGYNVTQYYSCAINPTFGSNSMLAGAQDNGTQKFSSAGINTTTNASGGDGGFCFIDQKNPLQQITNFTGTSLNISNNGGTSFTFTGSFTTDRFINPADYDTATSTTPALSTTARYYCGGAASNLRRVTINFSTLTVVSNSFAIAAATTSRSVSAVKVDPNTPDRVWVAMSTASGVAGVVPQLYLSSSSSTTPVFTAVTLPASITAGQFISSIDVENGDANHLLITLSNYGVASVYESTDLGVTWTSLDNNGVNLPDVPVRWGMFIPSGYSSFTSSVGGILLATELGVWSANSISGTTTPWAANNSSMGNVRADMIKLRGSDKLVAVATHGRGLFTAQLISASLPVQLTSFTGTLQNSKSALLQWTTSSEANSKQFELERSFDGVNYSRIATIPAAGNSNAAINYRYSDNSPLTDNNYYRLKSVDIDNKSKLSNIVLLKLPAAAQDLQVLGNPVKNSLTVRLVKPAAQSGELRLTDMAGRLVSRRIIAKGEQLMQMSLEPGRISAGIYIVQATIGTNKFKATVIKE